MLQRIAFILSLSLILSACQTIRPLDNTNLKLSDTTIQVTNTPSPTPVIDANKLLNIKTNQKMFATLKTTKGDIKVELFADKTPQTVANFVGLAEGTQTWTDPKTGQKVTDRPLYQNVLFHRVIKGFMIQGGDPLGTGTGGPGYRFADEPFEGEYKQGTLAMANAGPNTNGSQFFIMHKDYSLPPNYVIFGQVVSGQDVVDAIANTKTDANDRPLENILIKSIQIERQ